jgi:hypothetical protein
MSVGKHDSELADFAADLAALLPQAGGLNRDLVLYRAGQASARRQRWVWPASTACVTLVAAVLVALAYSRPPGERVVVVRVVEPVPESSPAAAAMDMGSPAGLEQETTSTSIAYRRLENQVLRWGLEGIPDSALTANALPSLTVFGGTAGWNVSPRVFEVETLSP